MGQAAQRVGSCYAALRMTAVGKGALIDTQDERKSHGLPFMTMEEMRLVEAPGWLIEGLLPSESVAMLFGVEGTHKSFIAIDMALSVAGGVPFHGRRVDAGQVVFVAAE